MRSYAHSLNGLERALPPENEFLYRTKPLPPPPIPPKDADRLTQSLTTTPRIPHRSKGGDHLPQQPLPLVLPPSQHQTGRMSLPASPAITSITGRRSSQKVQQITGYDVASNDFLPLRRIQFSSSSPTDSSSNYSQSFDGPIFEEETPRYSESSAAPPPLDPDCDGMSSKRSSGAPKSPQCVQFNTPSTRKPTLSHYSSAPGALDPSQGLHVSVLEDVPWRVSKSYNYFSDNETADEYHRITSDLATLSTRDSTYNKSPLLAPTQSSFSSRLSLSAKSLFSRRREPSISLESHRASFASGHHPPKTPNPPTVHPLSIESHITSSPRSVFDTDDEGDDEIGDHNVREAIKGYFARRSEDRVPTEPIVQHPLPSPRPERSDTPRVFAKTGGQVKELLSGARNGVKMLHTSRAEKRRNQLRSRIRVIPEGPTEGNFI